MILIIGATGKLGRVVIETLLKKMPPENIVAFVRDADKAEDLKTAGVNIKVGEYDDKQSLDAAMKGVEKVLQISGGNAPNLVEQHTNVVEAAKKGGVKCFAYTGRALKNRTTLVSKFMDTHFQTDDILMASGMNFILFRNSLYMDSLPFSLGPNVAETGINLPVGEGKVAFALRSDFGEAIAIVLLQEDCSNHIYNFTGAKACSYNDVAEALSEIIEKQIVYNNVEPEVFVKQLVGRGVPEQIAHQAIRINLAAQML
ncbi:MAG: NmrA family NAD(P)-binding protein [Bacteroidota bacterium]|nr:NmrA family NAD(P)-binding protein [Bacteroidota bacterium]